VLDSKLAAPQGFERRYAEGKRSPAAILADLSPASVSAHQSLTVAPAAGPAAYKPLDLKNLEASTPSFVATFTKDKAGFYINGQKYSPDADPMVRVRIGTFEHWRVVNNTREIHPMHLHSNSLQIDTA